MRFGSPMEIRRSAKWPTSPCSKRTTCGRVSSTVRSWTQSSSTYRPERLPPSLDEGDEESRARASSAARLPTYGPTEPRARGRPALDGNGDGWTRDGIDLPALRDRRRSDARRGRREALSVSPAQRDGRQEKQDRAIREAALKREVGKS